MSLNQRIQRKWREWKPVVVPTFVVFLNTDVTPVVCEDNEFQIVEVNTPDDPLLPKLCPNRRQAALAREAISAGRWSAIVALKDGEPIGRIWEAFGSETGFFTGVPRFRVADDEFFMFDLFVEREYRRGLVAFTMADYFFKKHPLATTSLTYAYGFVAYENSPSILWHDAVGFLIGQRVSMLHIGPYVKWRLPFSDSPSVGPLSRRNRTVDPSLRLSGRSFMPAAPPTEIDLRVYDDNELVSEVAG